jgi:hypothetical protein
MAAINSLINQLNVYPLTNENKYQELKIITDIRGQWLQTINNKIKAKAIFPPTTQKRRKKAKFYILLPDTRLLTKLCENSGIEIAFETTYIIEPSKIKLKIMDTNI